MILPVIQNRVDIIFFGNERRNLSFESEKELQNNSAIQSDNEFNQYYFTFFIIYHINLKKDRKS